MTAIEVTGLGYTYPGSDQPALADLDVSIPAGRVTLVTGRLGAGCSTLLEILAGVAPRLTGGTLTGTVRVLGVDPSAREGGRTLVGRVVMLLPTPSSQLSGMTSTVRDEVAFGPANLGWDRQRIARVVDGELDRLGIAGLADRDPATLSGGELQRVILAGCLAMEPEVLLLDEPAAELDPPMAERLYALLPELTATTVVLATTDVDRASPHVQEVVVLDGGGVVAAGSPSEALGQEAVVGLDAGSTVARIVYEAGGRGRLPIDVAGVREWIAS